MSVFVELKNPQTVEFYNENPSFDFEEANVLLIKILKNYKPIVPIENTQIENIQIEPKNSIQNISQIIPPNTQNLEQLLNKISPTSEIMNNMNNEICGDYIVITPNKHNIIIENKINKINISSTVVNNFVNSCKTHKSNGILMSQHSGITGKQNFDIDFIDSNVIIYMHHTEYNEEKIQLAIEIIHKIHNKISILNEINNISIPPNVLCEIKNEYQHFVSVKEEIKSNIKSSQGLIIQQIDNMKLLNLDEYLSTKFTQIDKKYLHKCNLCNFYTSNTLKGMAAHKRGCKKKFTNIEK